MTRLWLEYLNAFRNVARQYRRSLFGMAAVAFGVVSLLLASGFVEWIFWATREGTIQNGLGHVHVVKRGFLEHGQADPMDYLMPDQGALREALEALPQARTVAPRLAFNGMISHDEATISFIGEGVDARAELDLSSALIVASGQALSPEVPDGVMLGRGLANNLGVAVGDTVVLLAGTQSGGLNAVEAVVVGLFTTVSKAYDDSALRLSLPLAQELLRVSGVHRWIVVLQDTHLTTGVGAELRDRFGAEFQVVAWYELADFYNKLVELLSRQMGVVELIIAVIIVLSITNMMMMNVLERTSEIGTCLALGRRRRQILLQFVCEGLTIGLIGGVLGLVAGSVLAWTISLIGIPMPPPPGMSEGYDGEILLTAALVSQAFLLAIGTALLASVYPAWKASRLEIVDALRHNR